MTVARSAQIAIILLGLYILVVSGGAMIFVRRALTTQESQLDDYLRSIGRSVTEPARDYFYVLEFLTDPVTGLISEDALADYQQVLAWEDLQASMSGPAAEERISEVVLLTPEGETIMTSDGTTPDAESRLDTMDDDPQLRDLATEGQIAGNKLARGEFVKRIYFPVRTTSGSIVAVLRLENNPMYFQEILRARNRIVFGFVSSLVVLVILWFITMRLVRRTILAERAAGQAGRLRALGSMTAGIAHEIRNPLNILTLQIEELEAGLNELPDATQRGGLEAMARELKLETERLRGLTEQFLGLARAGSDPRQKSVAVRVERVVETVVGLWQKGLDLERREINIRNEAPGALALFSEDRLRQVLLNLLSNADDAIGKEHGTIEVGLKREQSRVLIIISDSGVGVAPENVSRLFDPFFTTRAQGTGLGLSLSQTLVQAAGGSIEVESKPGRGTKFIVSLPAAE